MRSIRWIRGLGYSLALVSSSVIAQGAPSLVGVGDHRLEVLSKGDGEPAVVFESGFAGGMFLWRKVQDRVAERTRAIAYERAGVGKSEAGPEPRSAKQIALELRELLEREQVAGPIVLVGHSAGGMYARVFAHEYPQRIAALVLVDPATEGYYERLRKDTPEQWKNAPIRLPAGLRAQWEALPAAMSEAGAAWPLPQVPVLMFTAKTPLGSWPLASESDMAAFLREHDTLAARIPGVERITIDAANHMTVLNDPQVGEKILALVERVRANR